MNIVESILAVLKVGLSLWLSKEKSKYEDRLQSLELKWYAEWNKPEDIRSDAVLDNLTFELKVLAHAFVYAVQSEAKKDV